MRTPWQHLYRTLIILLSALMAACASTRHVPQGSRLLDRVEIEIEGDRNNLKTDNLHNYLRQTPNHQVLGCLKLQLATYNISGHDTTRWWNRWIRKMGQPPVIYSDTLTQLSSKQLRQALVNRGYMDSRVEAITLPDPSGKKMGVRYKITTGQPHIISDLQFQIPDTAVAAILLADTTALPISKGQNLNRDNLDATRIALTQRLRNNGFYNFTKEHITFIADTAPASKNVTLTLKVNPARNTPSGHHQQSTLRNIIVLTCQPDEATDTLRYQHLQIIYGPDKYLKPSVIEEKCHLQPGQLFDASKIDATYAALSRLGILKSINIEMRPAPGNQLDALILLSRNKKQALSFEVEGTNSEGDLGFGVGLTYRHRNVAKRSQQLTTRLRVNYESLSGNFNGLINDRYTEYAAETSITYPRFEFPFVSEAMRRRLRVSTEFALSFNYQERPEYTRIIAGGAWKYKWGNLSNLQRYTYDLIDINYVNLPKHTTEFLDLIAPDNPLLRYSYEDHFIMRTGFSYHTTNRRTSATGTSTAKTAFQKHVYSLRTSIETAGNLLYAISSLTRQKRQNDVYRIFGIQYSQYAKADIDYTLLTNFTDKHTVAFHLGAGIAIPYGNSSVLPFEKRFYAGGANSVRGWGVRTLGPGSYDSRNSVSDFLNQCGDIRLDLNLEYRSRLFWILEGTAFIDAGNIWTIRNYKNQPGGEFKLDRFWQQIALAYGLGLRLDFTYFLIRLDLGIKAYNPAQSQQHWPLIHPNWRRDAAFHFAVGYPF